MHFHIHKGINQKVEQVEFFENLSPLGNDVLFKMIMKKNESEINWDCEIRTRARAPRYRRGRLHPSYTKYASENFFVNYCLWGMALSSKKN